MIAILNGNNNIYLRELWLLLICH